MRNHRVLITGGAGFVGSELVRQLAARGARVHVVDSLVTGKRENLEDVVGENVELTVADIRDYASMAQLFRDVDIVFHLACLGSQHSLQSPIENQEVNASATLGLLKIARNEGVGRFVYVSSSEVYGMVGATPIVEDHPTQPYTVYGASKLAAEAYTSAFWHTYRYPTTVLRLFNTYGPRSRRGDEGGVIPRLMLRCLAGQAMEIFGDGKQTRDFTFVTDMAVAILEAGWSENCVGQTINLGSGRDIEIQTLAAMISEVVGRTSAEIMYSETRQGDVPRLLCNCSKARKFLHFEINTGLRDGLAQLRDWYSGQGHSIEDLLQQNAGESRRLQDLPTNAA